MKKTSTWVFLKFFIFTACVVVALCHFIILPPFKALEQSELSRNLDRCQVTLQVEAKSLSVMLKDWAEWNDTYTFVQDGNERYIEDNLEWGYLSQDLGLNTLYIINLEGHIIWGESSQTPSASFPSEALDLILPQGAVFQEILAGKPVSGIFPSAEGYWLIAANKITQTLEDVSIKGIMVMGKLLTPDYFSKLSHQLQLDFSLRPAPEGRGIEAIKGDLVGSKWRLLTSDKAQAFRRIDDLAKSTSTWIAITVPRDIYNQGFNTAWVSGVVLFVLGMGFSLLWTRNTDKTNKLRSASLLLTAQGKNLRESEEKYRRFFSTVTHGWAYHKIITDDENRPIDYIFLEVNEAYERLTGLVRDEIIGKRVTEVLPDIKSDSVNWIDCFGQVALSGIATSFENYSETLSKWYAVSASCPETGHFIVVFDDITERKQLEAERNAGIEELHHSHELMQYIISHVRGAIAVHDRDLNYVYVSDRYLEEYGVTEQEVIGRHHYEVFPDLPQKWRDVHQRCLKGEVLSAEEDPYYRADGSVDWTRWECRPWFEADHSIGGIIVYTEVITERKQKEEQRLELEAQLRQKHKMEAVGYLAGGMAHNFNNNLSIILGNVELAQLKQPHNSDVFPLLENAKIAVNRSRDLVKQIITYSRKGMQVLIPISLLSIVNETVTLLKYTLPVTVNLRQFSNPACGPVTIHADASQIQEVLLNLCNNAVHAMGEKGDLTINMETVELEKKDIPAQYEVVPGRFAKLSVQDSGCGMPVEILDKIFDPFFTTKEAYEGAGMGLATVQGIVAQHGGLIKVNSVPARGTSFSLYFPIIAADAPEPAEEQEQRIEVSNGEEHILFIDDETMLANLGGEILSEMGYRVTIMTDSQEALKLFTANPNDFDLVISDQTMPELTGEELIQKLKQIKPDVPTILCTGFSSKIDEDKANEQGINTFLMKPLDMSKLAQAVRQVLDGGEKA